MNQPSMVTVGIVGHEAAKFTADTEARARALIRKIIARTAAGLVVSGACRLGGIDIWAIEEATALGVPTREFPPASDDWDHGFKPRNIEIAEASTVVYSIVVATLPPSYTGRRFRLCYHCGTADHVKSGGCWTVKHAKAIGRRGHVLVI
jgi:hypothetical protein